VSKLSPRILLSVVIFGFLWGILFFVLRPSRAGEIDRLNSSIPSPTKKTFDLKPLIGAVSMDNKDYAYKQGFSRFCWEIQDSERKYPWKIDSTLNLVSGYRRWRYRYEFLDPIKFTSAASNRGYPVPARLFESSIVFSDGFFLEDIQDSAEYVGGSNYIISTDKNDVDIWRNKLGELNVNNLITGPVSFYQNRIGNLKVTGLINLAGDVSFNSNKISNIAISKSRLMDLYIDSLQTDSPLIFSEDTIEYSFRGTEMQSAKLGLFNSRFEGSFSLSAAGDSKLLFDNCSFTDSFALKNLNVANLYFANCTSFENDIYLKVDSSANMRLYFDAKTDLDRIKFFYDPTITICMNPYVSEDLNRKVFDGLEAKFKKEYHSADLERLEIEHARYEYSRSWYKYPIWLLDFTWWYYGFKKWLILLWTMGFLLIFFIFNFRNWGRMNAAYRIFDNKIIIESQGGARKGRSLFSRKGYFAMIYTLYIFFSLKIDFDKLEYDDRKCLRSFFVQYCVGLICLFFLANAIFKIA